ncbi:YccF domain-containing protein [Saccharopolyspora oryzae]|uniref:YccF domain-containing protein n=1 Tax=Saccharopolyspora oryzae TaxID=2997343 RepID=A0ABT4V2F1_9PSEU|nr:YccF domain-containing protein [Saccharopolyspora oryzae]MDA3628135.1 YccF domain-containing protein [Saccharopolyspora oryzae]
MRLLLNVIWLVFGGLWMALGYAFAGILLTITIIGIPFAIASFRMANFALWPFGRRLVDEPTSGAMAGIGNILWLVLAGWWLALGHILTGIAQCITIIGIPLGIANFKLIPVSLMPLGKRIVDADDAYAFMRAG